ncbi:diguanylate cyclase [Candidatus Omnitrophota bacterium]
MITLVIFYLVNSAALFYYFSTRQARVAHLEVRNQDLSEQINILNEQNSKEEKIRTALRERIARYTSLKKMIEEINQELPLESVADKLTSSIFSLIGDNRGTCILYLAQRGMEEALSIYKTKKEDKKSVVKAKQGDIFDLWVLKHTSPLLVKDTRSDFRFDIEKSRPLGLRPVSSLISIPLISENKFLGILRLDNPSAGFYSQDDLRLLATIGDFGAVAIENGLLFQRTQDLAIHDGLTSLFTKDYFLERLRSEHKRGVRQGLPLSLLMLDIDHFKDYNDNFGHSAGDLVLKDLSGWITGSLKDEKCVISRFGGEEFCVILPGTPKDEAIRIAEGLRRKIEGTDILLRREKTRITVSIGVAEVPSDVKDEDGLIFKADQAMYQAKQKGRNRVCSI